MDVKIFIEYFDEYYAAHGFLARILSREYLTKKGLRLPTAPVDLYAMSLTQRYFLRTGTSAPLLRITQAVEATDLTVVAAEGNRSRTRSTMSP